ncbi:MAG TPA: hypothetical protein VLB44_27720 [Kofleriaceae bacterium]|nr:hypothetical protein [Kofleriaceae bacterium]
MADVTFRDFAGAVMQGNAAAAASVLETLLALSPDAAMKATEHFRGRMSDPAFMPKAMGLRTAVTSGTDAQIGDLLVDCFGLDDTARASAITALRRRYPAPA